MGWSDLVVDGRNTGSPKGVDVAEWALIVAWRFWDLFLGESWRSDG